MSPLSISLLVILAFMCRAAISDKQAVENLEIVILNGDSSILSANGTFKLGFFNNNQQPRWFLGISYASIPTPTYVWVANRENPVKNLTSLAGVFIGADGKLTVRDSDGEILWKTENEEPAAAAKLLEDGNLVLVDTHDSVVWQSFDFPADTWLPGMNLSGEQSLTPWRSSDDPSPGLYSLRLKQSDYSELELVFNGTIAYWSSGNWTGNAFSGVPEMMIQYLYRFHFTNPSSPAASFGYMETATESGIPPLTRFKLESTGQFHQYTWSSQTESWNVFWRAPDNLCNVYGLCGNFGFCTTQLLNPCKCLAGYKPVDDSGWASGDFSRGCQLENESACESNNGFEEIGAVSVDRAIEFPTGSRTFCEKACRSNCSCFGYYLNEKTGKCKALFGSMINLHNLTSDSISEDILYVKVPKGGLTMNKQKKKISMAALIGIICGLLSILSLLTFVPLFLYVKKRRLFMMMMKSNEPMINLKVFSYDELNTATGGFSEKLGHGGFGAVFKGELPGSDIEIAVKRLERIGGGEREFRAEVCTVGNIQHVNLVRLIGFCSEKSHRLLVYDYMLNGSLSDYLKRDGRILNWDDRFKIAIGTAKGLAYLHEGCRDCIIHCDIKPENILLDNDFVPKVSDFGLAKLIGRDFSRVLATMRGTWGYVAPEWISGVAITSKADVYSYGMTMLELLGGRRNVEGPPPTVVDGDGVGEKWFFPPWAAEKIIEGGIDLVVDFRLGGRYDMEEVRRLGLVAIWCIQDEEATRPSMRDVLKMLEGLVEVGIPPPPKLLQALVSGESFKGVIVDSDGGATTGPLPSENSPNDVPIHGRNTF